MSIDNGSPAPNGFGAQYSQPPAKSGSGWIRIVLYLLIIAAIAGVVYRVVQNRKATQAASVSQVNAIAAHPAAVQVAAVQQKPMPIFVTALGTVTPYMSVTVKARVSGELLPVKFTEGQTVKQNQTIMVIDPKPYQAALDQAKGTLAHDQALLANAQAEVNRYKALFDAGVTSKETLDSDQAQLGQYQGAIEADKATIENAQLQLSWCYVQAPIGGKIGLRLVDPGNVITANTTNLVVINQFQPIAVYFTLPEVQLPQVLKKLAGNKRLPVDAYDRDDKVKIASGYLLTADNQIDTTTGTDKLKAVFDNKDSALFPNQFVNIHLVLENRPNALVVPTAAIQSGLQGNFVWAIGKDDKGNDVAKMAPVKIALAEGQQTILDGGVDAGTNVVVDGSDRLRNGALVSASQARQHAQGGQGAAGGTTAGQATSGAPGTSASDQQNGQHQHTHKEQ